MITRSNRPNKAFIEAYQNAQKAAEKAAFYDKNDAGYPDVVRAEGEKLSVVSDMIPDEVSRLAALAETGIELMAELIALLFRTAETTETGLTIAADDLFSGLVGNVTSGTVEVSTGLVLDDLAGSWETITADVKGNKELLASARSAIKSPDQWNDIHALFAVINEGNKN